MSAGGKILFCSFCGKSQHEVKKLIAGPSVFMCDECVDLCVDIIYDGEGNARITRTIVFEPDNAQAGISILANFSRIIQQKYPGVPVEVKIEQRGNEVSMLIVTPTGEQERVLETLESYGMVVLGKMRAEELLVDPIHVMELNNKLRLAHLELQMTKELLELGRVASSERIGSLEAQVASLHGLIGKGLACIPSMDELIKCIREYRTTDDVLKNAVSDVIRAHAEGLTQPDQNLAHALRIIESRDAGLYQDLKDVAKDWFGGMAVSATTGAFALVSAALPK